LSVFSFCQNLLGFRFPDYLGQVRSKVNKKNITTSWLCGGVIGFAIIMSSFRDFCGKLSESGFTGFQDKAGFKKTGLPPKAG